MHHTVEGPRVSYGGAPPVYHIVEGAPCIILWRGPRVSYGGDAPVYHMVEGPPCTIWWRRLDIISIHDAS